MQPATCLPFHNSLFLPLKGTFSNPKEVRKEKEESKRKQKNIYHHKIEKKGKNILSSYDWERKRKIEKKKMLSSQNRKRKRKKYEKNHPKIEN